MRAIILAACITALCLCPAAAATITGQVIGLEGQPVVGAEVIVTTNRIVDPPGRVLTLTTDQSGKFSVEIDRALPRGYVVGKVFVHVPGLALGGGDLTTSYNVFHLKPMVQITGTVRRGTPVEGAMLRLVSCGADWGGQEGAIVIPESVRDKFTVKTGADGGWTISNVRAGSQAEVVLDDPRYAKASYIVRLGPSGGRALPISALPAATIIGKVTLENGEPAEGIKVFAHRVHESRTQEHLVRRHKGVTAADGSYRLDRVGRGTYWVTADDPSGKWVPARALEEMHVSDVQTVPAPPLVLTRGSIVKGVVVDDDTGEPLAGATVFAYVARGASFCTTTDSQGRYRLRVAPGHIRMDVEGRQLGYYSLGETELDIGKGEIGERDLRLKKGLTLPVVAVDTEGRPATGALILVGSFFAHGISVGEAIVDETGRLEVSGLAPGLGAVNVMRGDDWDLVDPPEGKASFEIPTAGPLRVVLRKVGLLPVFGRVITTKGEPVADVVVKMTILEMREDSRKFQVKSRPEVVTDAEGRYSLSGVREDATVIVSAEVPLDDLNVPRFKYVTGGIVTKEKDGFKVSDIVMTPLLE